MSKRRAANTVNRMEIFQKNRNLSVPKTKIDSIIVLVKATQGGRKLALEHLSQENHPENHKAEGSTPCASQRFCVQLNGIRLAGGDWVRHRAMRL